jgi:hypothetical protein
MKRDAIMEHLLLQKPHAKSNAKEHTRVLRARLVLWKNGELNTLLDDAVAIQERLNSTRSPMTPENLARKFAEYVFTGNVRAAVRLLDQEADGGLAELTPSVIETLKSLHPEPTPPDPEVLHKGDPPKTRPVIFDAITEDVIRKAVLKVQGSGGVSRTNAKHWRRILTSFGTESKSLRESLAMTARRMCGEYVDPSSLQAFVANRLVPLAKAGGGVRPIGVGELKRRIIGKAVMMVFGKDVEGSVGSFEMCVGQKGGVEAIIHTMISMFKADISDAIILMDASNCFNRFNRMVCLHNIRFDCPAIACFTINLYRLPARLFVTGVDGNATELLSREGATQGCPMAMPMCALTFLPLIKSIAQPTSCSCGAFPWEGENEGNALDIDDISSLQPFSSSPVGASPDDERSEIVQCVSMLDESDSDIEEGTHTPERGDGLSHDLPSRYDLDSIILDHKKCTCRELRVQGWYADDGQAVGTLDELRKWAGKLLAEGPKYGFIVKLAKCLVVLGDPDLADKAQRMFEGTGIKVAKGGSRDLGAALGSDEFVSHFLKGKCDDWVAMVERLAEFARTQPHAAHSAFTRSLKHKWTFTQRTMPGAEEFLQPLEDAIREKFLPSMFGPDGNWMEISPQLRDLIALPARLGGLGIPNPVEQAPRCHADSVKLTKHLAYLVATSQQHDHCDSAEDKKAIKKAIASIKAANAKRQEEEWQRIHREAEPKLARVMEFTSEKGASGLFSASPLRKYGLPIEKKHDWYDIVRMRYLFPLTKLPDHCVCQKPYSLDHSQICKVGGFIHWRHDSVAKLFAGMCKEVHRDVELEPMLAPLSGEVLSYKSANADDSARSDVRVRGFNRFMKNAFFEFRVFYPLASSYAGKEPKQIYSQNERARVREYEERVKEAEAASFTPMVMSALGGMGKCMQDAVKCLAHRIAEKRNEEFSKVMGLVRCLFSVAMVRAALVCLRGTRTPRNRVRDAFRLPEIDVAVSELDVCW